MCVADWNREKFTKTTYFWSRSFNVIDVGTAESSSAVRACYEKQQVCVYLASATAMMLD